MQDILILEPFYGGSHKYLIDCLIDGLNSKYKDPSTCLITLSAKKWHWRARTSALYISQVIPKEHTFKILFASCVLNLAELLALRPDLAHTKKIVYFHENQLVYPVRKEKERDFQYGYNQILTCMVADIIVFNSKYNHDSFLDSINKFLKLQPDYRPKDLKTEIGPKCRVLYYPVKFPSLLSNRLDNTLLHIVWPHRWEHDKDPDTFFEVLLNLMNAGHNFQLSVLGESYSEVPPVFDEAHKHLASRIVNWGFQETKEKYYEILMKSDVVVSTAKHEFYGVAMLEATYCGCFPLCPNKLVYPELYPSICLYKDKDHLTRIIKEFCENPNLPREMRQNLKIDFEKFSSDFLIDSYRKLLSLENIS